MAILDSLRALWAGTRPGSRSGAPGEARGTQRWVVLDVETSGLDTGTDALLAIGAVAVHGDRIAIADSFETLVRPERASSRDNILLHGIGEQAQLEAVDPGQACRALSDYAGDAPLVAFHASFDRAFLRRATKAGLGRALGNRWLDLAELAPALYPDVKARALDDWLGHFGIAVDQRHHASSDALATATLFIRLLAAIPPAQRGEASVRRIAAAAKWVAR